MVWGLGVGGWGRRGMFFLRVCAQASFWLARSRAGGVVQMAMLNKQEYDVFAAWAPVSGDQASNMWDLTFGLPTVLPDQRVDVSRDNRACHSQPASNMRLAAPEDA